MGKTATKEQVEVYFDLLNDIRADVLMEAARRAVMQHEFATIPPVATLRKIAAEIQGNVTGLSAMAALSGVRKLIREYGGAYADAEDMRKAMAKMPPQVAACVQAFGWMNLCESTNPDTLQAQWRMNWDATKEQFDKQAATIGGMRLSVAEQSRLGGSSPRGTYPGGMLDTSKFGVIPSK